MVRIGLIGYNEGNGHPYSFSAIINGYDKERIDSCPYIVIRNYLKAHPDHEVNLAGMEVTHVWCPQQEIARNIADCSMISNVVDDYREMANKVDAVIVARDDVDSHYEIAKFFLEKGLFVLVDKPLCRNEGELNYFMPYLQNGKLMSCSGLRYKSEMRTSFYGALKRSDVIAVNAYSVVDWYKYAIHVLEAVTPIMGYNYIDVIPLHGDNYFMGKICYADGKYLTIQINKQVSFGIKSDFYLKDGRIFSVSFDDNFGCFKYMLEEFHRMIIERYPVIDPQETQAIIKAIIKGGPNA